MENLVHLRYHLAFWRLIGVLPPKTFKGLVFVVIFHILNLINFILMILGLVTSSKEQVFDSLSFLFPITCIQYRALVTRFHQKRLRRISDYIGILKGQMNSKKEIFLFEKCIRQSEFVYKFASIFYCTSLSMMALTTLFLGKLSSPTWLPFDIIKNKQYFIIIHLCQDIICYVPQGAEAALNDSYLVANMMLIKTQIQILCARVEKIGWTSTNRQSNFMELIDIIRCHKIILKILSEVSSWTSSSLLVLYFISAMTQCCFAVYITQVSFQAVVPLFMLLICSTFETLLPCYFGDDLKHTSLLFVDSINRCNWLDQSLTFKKTLILFLCKAQKPMVVLAGGFIPCSMHTFITIQKVAYSIFVLFK